MKAWPTPLLRIALIAGLLTLLSCGDDSPTGPDDPVTEVVTDTEVVVNPSGVAPLTAEVYLTTSEPVTIAMTIPGRDGAAPLQHTFDDPAQAFRLPILGLYPGSTTEVTLQLFDASGSDLGTIDVPVSTSPLISDLPDVTIDAISPSAMKPGLHLVSYFGHDGALNPQRPFIFDNAGTIRWYLDYSDHETLSDLFYDNGVERLANGNLYFGDGNTNQIYEINMLGEIQNTWAMPGYGFHHDVLEKPDGNFVVTVNKQGEDTIEDYIIEIDRTSGEIVNEWNLNQSLDNTRRTWDTDIADLNVDWFHANALAYDATDNTIIVSGRTQGTVKLTANNEVVWILAPHKGWDTAGDGTDLSQFLLQPLDASGQPIEDEEVLTGTANHPDFEWAWYQHAPALLPNGTLLLFDNGENRNYSRPGTYSRAVAYRIDEAAMTIQQDWQYGKERGRETYSRIVSDVDYHASEDNVVFMPGAVNFNGAVYGKIVEVDYDSRDPVFEATITPPTAPFNITFHRVERMPLYPPTAE